MHRIRKLTKKDFNYFTTIVVNAYPGFKINTEEQFDKCRQRFIKLQKYDPIVNFYGLFKKKKLLGGMRLHDFTMNFSSRKLKVGGVGLIAVDLAHKKEKVCKEMMIYFLEHFKKKGACMTALYPFHPDFYRKMGFGYGTKMNRYRVKPALLPRGRYKEHITSLGKKDMQLVISCYNRFFKKNHGMMEKTKFELGWFINPNMKIIGYKSKNKILGYIAFSFKPDKEDNFISNNIHIREFICENRNVLAELLTFLHTQADQINYIVFNTQDEFFHHLLSDPRDPSHNLFEPVAHETNTQGIGIMYRVIDTDGIFRILKNHNFGNQNCLLKISLRDSFLKENEGSTNIHFVAGKPHLPNRGKHEAEIYLDISDFSSLIMGVVTFKTLHEYGLAEISHTKYLNTVNRIFKTEEKPKCTTLF